MKTLAQYLTEYIEHEMDRAKKEYLLPLRDWIKEGIDAYQSTENCSVSIQPNVKTSITYRLMHELIRSKTFILLGRYYVLDKSVPSFDNQVVVMDKLIEEAKEALRKQGYKV